MKRRWIFWLLIVGFVWLIVTRFAEVRQILQTMATGDWRWVAAAALAQIGLLSGPNRHLLVGIRYGGCP